jgi:hypothetical protein
VDPTCRSWWWWWWSLWWWWLSSSSSCYFEDKTIRSDPTVPPFTMPKLS